MKQEQIDKLREYEKTDPEIICIRGLLDEIESQAKELKSARKLWSDAQHRCKVNAERGDKLEVENERYKARLALKDTE